MNMVINYCVNFAKTTARTNYCISPQFFVVKTELGDAMDTDTL